MIHTIEFYRGDTPDGDAIILAGRYWMYRDGVIYDNERAQDIPLWVFRLRDFLTEAARYQLTGEAA